MKSLSYVVPVKSKVKILQNFVAFSEYMNFNINSIYRLWEDGDRIYRKLMVWKKMFLVDTPRTTTETVATYVFKEKIDLCLSSVWPKIKMAIGTIHYYQDQVSRFHEKIPSLEQRAIYPWQLIINAAEGQLILKFPFCVFKSTKKTTKFL